MEDYEDNERELEPGKDRIWPTARVKKKAKPMTEKQREYFRMYYIEHKEKIRQRQRDQCRNYPEANRRASRKYYDRHRDTVLRNAKERYRQLQEKKKWEKEYAKAAAERATASMAGTAPYCSPMLNTRAERDATGTRRKTATNRIKLINDKL